MTFSHYTESACESPNHLERQIDVDKNSLGVENDLFTPPSENRLAGSMRQSEEISALTSNWDAEISPIAKSPESDAGGGIIHISTDDPTATGSHSKPAFHFPQKSMDELGGMIKKLQGLRNEDLLERCSNDDKEDESRRSVGEDMDAPYPGSQESQCKLIPSVQLEDTTSLVGAPPNSWLTSLKKCSLGTSREHISNAHDDEYHSENNPPKQDRDDFELSVVQDDLLHGSSRDDLDSAKKKVGQSSNEFIERIRSAAHRRKVAMTRSRDSLVAKEREHLRSIAASKAKAAEKIWYENEAKSDDTDQQSLSSMKTKQFKARPLPATTGISGHGGLDGVPKVEKKPTTTPFSPLLGQRRQQKIKVKALEKAKMKTVRVRKASSTQKASHSRESAKKVVALPFKARAVPLSVGAKGQGGQTGVPKVPKRPVTMPLSPCLGPQRRATKPHNDLKQTTAISVSFKARPVPSSVGAKGHGGQTGVPKVPKRPVTVPSSPCLGPKRRAAKSHCDLKHSIPKGSHSAPRGLSQKDGRTSALQNISVNKKSIRSSTSTASSHLKSQFVANSPVLLGLRLLDGTPVQKHTTSSNDENLTPINAPMQAYQPHSTIRAKKRAEYDTRRILNLQRRQEDDRRQRQVEIRKIHKELNTMKMFL